VSFACRRFRAAFAPGSDDPHRRECPRCAAYAAALERAAGPRLPLPGALRQRLLAIPDEAADASVPVPSLDLARPAGPPAPQLPLPPELRARLLALPERSRRGGPPAWVLSPRYAVAASYVAAVLFGALLGGPGDLGRLVARGVERTLAAADLADIADRAGKAGRGRLESLETAARGAARRAGRSVGRSVQRLERRLPARPATRPAQPPKPDPEVHSENDAPRPARP
jgi:hypothetical protein